MLKTLQNFYKAAVATSWASGTGAVYVTSLPTPSAGYLVVNPSNSTKREIVSYSGTGTDGGGTYITLTARGVGGTTAQTHTVGEPIRMNITAELYAEIQAEIDALQDEIDTLVLQNAPNASTTVKGIVKLNVAPASATEPIALGSNDPRLTDLPANFVTTSAGAADAGKGAKLNASGVLDQSFTTPPIIRTYTTSGSPHTWTKPTGLKYIIAEIVGGGGGGENGETPTSGTERGGGAGGGGGYAKKVILAGSLGATETITIGAGGGQVSGAALANGTNGGNSTFGSILTANGGIGGGTDGSHIGGNGGASSGGDVLISGQKGGEGTLESEHGSMGGLTVLNTYGKGGNGGAVDSSFSGSSGVGGFCIVTEYYN